MNDLALLRRTSAVLSGVPIFCDTWRVSFRQNSSTHGRELCREEETLSVEQIGRAGAGGDGGAGSGVDLLGRHQ